MTGKHQDWRTRYAVDAATGCWVWTGAVQSKGYGCARVDGRVTRAHRAFYVEFRGPIPQGLVIDHLCRRRLCVNPAHMEAVTTRTNTIRGDSIAAVNAAKTHCMNGHSLSGDNLMLKPDGRRNCRECTQAGARAWWHRVGKQRRAAKREVLR